jgi:AraC-like DNA-binding protein
VESPLLDVTEREHYLRSFLALGFAAASSQGLPVGEQTCVRGVRRARELIHDRSSERLTVAEIARAAGCSVYHLERSFCAVTGLAVHAYLQQVRLARAMAMLRQGTRSAEASQATGFADQAHMTRAFRKWLGVTPRAFQRATGTSPRVALG